MTGKLIYNGMFKTKGKTLECRHCGLRHPVEEIEIKQGFLRPKGHHKDQIQLYALFLEKNWAKVIETFNQVLGFEKLPMLPITTTLGGAELVYLDMNEGVRVQVPIDLQEERVAFLKERLALHLIDPMPAESGWQCGYCPVVSACKMADSTTIVNEEAEVAIPD